MKDNLLNEINTKWKFDSNVANCFDDMLSRSIPQYEIMRKCVSDLSKIFIDNRYAKVDRDLLKIPYYDDFENKRYPYNCLDVGCSNGLMIKEMWRPNGNFLGIDISEPMLNKARETLSDKENVSIEYCDLRENFPKGKFDIITCILSLMFTPIEYRQHIVQNMYDSLDDGGCLFLVEKVLGNNDTISKMFTENYYNMKKENGYSQEQIDRKRLSLEGVQVCVTSDWNKELLKQAGFKQIDTFWRWCNFVGIIAIK